MFRALLYIVQLLSALPLAAQEYNDISVYEGEQVEILRGLDTTLFHQYLPKEDPYAEATKYYRPQLSQRRRGLDWWISDDVVAPLLPINTPLEQRKEQGRVRLYGSTEGYNVGLSANYATTSERGWSSYLDLDARTGRDVNIEGVFRQELRSAAGVSRSFSQNHHLSISLEAPILMRGLRSDTSQEAITLTGNNLYNPSWGLYNGEVRNSRVSKSSIPELHTLYQRPLGEATTLVADLRAEYGRRSVSRLGWYDGYNPTPDYYRKLPSYVEAGDTHDTIEQMWRENDTSYTQIGWDRLVAQNLLSSDGEAHYVVEDQVTCVAEAEAKLLFTSDVGDSVHIIYGLQGALSSNRSFKEMVDLLGGDYLIDHDLYIGDYANLNIDMQNDLRNPDREILVGDRFGYDYTLRTSDVAVVLGVEYRHRSFNLALRGEFGERLTQRVGHYEKERFSGSLSYGASSQVAMASNRVDLRLGYSPSGSHHFTIKGLYHQLPVDGRDLFIQVQCANRVIDNPTSRSLVSMSLGYRLEAGDFSLDLEGYLLYSSNETQVWSYYDDLSYTYSNVVVSGLGTRSLGVDLVADWKISRKLRWEVAMAMGDYTYDTNPCVTLYDDQNMSLTSTSNASAVVGCKVGNAPQLLATSSLTYFVDYGLILSFDCSYGGGRYVAPSFVRRTDRVIYYADSAEMVDEIVSQESLPGVFDLTASVVKTFWLRGGDRLSLNLRINNLLGDRGRVEYGRESNRILTTSGGSDVGARYVEASSYLYGSPRTLYLSCSYSF